jgi:hypothetical protein
MLHIYKYIISEYIDCPDKNTLLQGSNIQDFDLPFTISRYRYKLEHKL